MSDSLRSCGLYSPWNSPGWILEWVAFSFSRNLPNPGIEPRSPALQMNSYQLSHKGSLSFTLNWWINLVPAEKLSVSKVKDYLKKKIFFLMWTLKKNLYWICYTIASVLCFVFWTRRRWDFSSLTRDQTCSVCIGRWSLSHWITREVLIDLFFFIDSNLLKNCFLLEDNCFIILCCWFMLMYGRNQRLLLNVTLCSTTLSP